MRNFLSSMAIVMVLGLASSGVFAATHYDADVTAATLVEADAVNILGQATGYQCTLTTLTMGGAGVSLTLTNGADATGITAATYIGSGTSSNNNSVVIGNGSVVGSSTSGANFYVGNSNGGSNNTVTINAGGSIAFTLSNTSYTFIIGYGTSTIDADYNKVVVNGGSLTYTVGGTKGIVLGNGAAANNNSLVVQNAGQVSTNYVTVGSSGSNNNVTVTGAGSKLIGGSNFNLSGSSTAGETGNTVTLVDGGILKLTNTGSYGFKWHSASLTSTTVNTGEDYVQFSGGFLARYGSRASELTAAFIQVWDGTYTAGAKNYVMGTYNAFSTTDALQAGEYTYLVTSASTTTAQWQALLGSYYTADLATELTGYTIWTGYGVPEPTTMALLAIGGIGVLVRRRRK